MGNIASGYFFSSPSSGSSASLNYGSCKEDDANMPSKFLNDNVMNNSMKRFRKPTINVNNMNQNYGSMTSSFSMNSLNKSNISSESKYRIPTRSEPSSPKSVAYPSYSTNSLPFSRNRSNSRENQQKSTSPDISTPPKRSMSMKSEDGTAYMINNNNRVNYNNKSPSSRNKVHPVSSFQQHQMETTCMEYTNMNGRRSSIIEERTNVEMNRNRSNSLPASMLLNHESHHPKNTIILHSPHKRTPQHIVSNVHPHHMVFDTPIVCLTLPDEPPVHDHLNLKKFPRKEIKRRRKISRQK